MSTAWYPCLECEADLPCGGCEDGYVDYYTAYPIGVVGALRELVASDEQEEIDLAA